ncbi:MAG: outer membrane beta-barrel protein [Pseudolabrys sp.]|nr:outer membrane beta-barrel protein [Pseudolabrys sp.]
MRGFFIRVAVVTSAIAFTQVASAAPPQVPGWTGWYAGLNAGGNWGGGSVSASASNSQYCSICGHSVEYANASIQGAAGEFPGRTDGFIGGGQFGYNWKIASRWIAGIEADFHGLAGAGTSSATSASFDVAGFAGHSVVTDLLVSKSIDFLGTVRGRLGYLVEQRLLVFGTGGFAYCHVKSSLTISQNLTGSGLGALETNPATASNVSRMQAGWTLSGGFEWLFASNWTAKVEYLYYDLGRVSYGGQIADRIVSPAPPTPYYFVNDVRATTRFNGNIVRAGLNYHF